MTESTLPELWQRLIRYLGEKSPILANHLKFASPPAIFGPNSLAIPFHSEYNHARDACSSEGNTRRITEALAHLTGRAALIRFEQAAGAAPARDSSGQPTATDRKKHLMGLPMFKKAGETLGAQIWHVEEGFNPMASLRKTEGPQESEDDLDTTTQPDPEET